MPSTMPLSCITTRSNNSQQDLHEVQQQPLQLRACGYALIYAMTDAPNGIHSFSHSCLHIKAVIGSEHSKSLLSADDAH